MEPERDSKLFESTSPEIPKQAADARFNLLPVKSKNLYEKAYDEFLKWCTVNKIKSYTEDALVDYFSEKSTSRKASSLWSYYSMLKITLSIHDNTDISKFSRLTAFLKRNSDGYKPKKSKILTRDQIDMFLSEAPDDSYLMIKVALIFGIAGACRREELTQLSVDDIQDLGSTLLVTIRESKTRIRRMFSVIDNKARSTSFLGIYRKYASLRQPNTEHRRFFVFYRQGKCSKQVVGKNIFGQLPSKIAAFLKLPDPEEYTGRCFRSSFATLLAETGNNIVNVKRHASFVF